MTNKNQLQQELLKKVKPGVKPSDLKKQQGENNQFQNNYSDYSDQGILTPPPTPPLKPVKSDDLSSPIVELENEDKSEQSEQNNQALLEKVKELEAKNKNLNKTIDELKNQANNKENNQEQKLFTCHSCSQEWSQEFLRLVDKNGNKTCSECVENMLDKASQETGQNIQLATDKKEPETKIKYYPCRFCQQIKPETSLKDRHITNLLNHDPREIVKICQDCLTYRAIKADYYCPLTSEGRDTYEGNEFDCYCPRTKYF